MYKKISLALSLLTLSSQIFAGQVGDTVIAPTGVNLIAPDSQGVWSLGLELLSMTPNNVNFQYATVSNSSIPTGTTQNKSVDGSHSLGGTIDLSYVFPGNGRDIQIAYTRLHLTDNDNAVSTAGTSNTLNIPFSNLTVYDNASGSVDQDLDAFDLLFGQWIRIGSRVDLHPFAGLGYARIKLDDKANYTDNSNNANYSTGKIKSDFSGLGPRAGMDVAVHLTSGISFIGTAGASILIGNLDSKITGSNYLNAQYIDGYQYKNSNSTQTVPELDARLGVNYTYRFNPGTALGLEFGYQAVTYFDVMDTDYIDTLAVNTINNSQNFGYYGPYFRLQFSVV